MTKNVTICKLSIQYFVTYLCLLYVHFFPDKDDVLEDADFEKGILESTKIYEVEIGDDGESELILLDEYFGKVPSKKWLASDKVCVSF